MTLKHGFELRREQHISEINSTVRHYIHQRTGAELLSLSNSDENKVFGVALRTPPTDSTGIAHILEHSVLCGSNKYPVKAPFLELIKGSLKTFLNAFTYPDKTVYPVASQNLQDFYNLVDVYLDAVFHPRLTPETLKQEGWHYEITEPGGPLTYKGVVFNEMKGAYSSPDQIVGRATQRTLFPDTIYGVDSGGDPACIPDLSYETFKTFHERYYHPSNARFFFYGDDEEEKRLERLGACLAEFTAITPDSAIPLQPRFDAPRKSRVTFAANEQEHGAQARITINWMLDEITQPETGLAVHVLGRILTGTAAAPLRKALIDSGLGESLTGWGMTSVLRQTIFSTGLKGIDAANAEKVETLVFDTLAGLAHEGIDPATVDAAINTTEFRLRENNTGSFPRGIAMMVGVLEDWLHERDPFTSLAWEAPLVDLKARLSNGERVFEDLIRRYLIDNPHRTVVLFEPDTAQSARETMEERARLDAAHAAMSEDDLKAVVRDMENLKHLQETPDSAEALATIPTLTLADLPREVRMIPIETGEMNGTRIVTHDLTTSGIVYFDIGFDLHTLAPELLPYVGLFSRALLETGTAKENFVELTQRIGRSTGGISRQTWTSALANDRGNTAAWLFLRAKALPEKTGEMLAILRDVLLEAKLDNRERIEQMVREAKASAEAALIPNGSAIVGGRLRAGISESDWVTEQMSGIDYLHFLRGLADRMNKGEDDVLVALTRIRDTLINRPAMICNITTDGVNMHRFKGEMTHFLAEMPDHVVPQMKWPTPNLPAFEGLTIPAKVNYVGKGENLYRLGFTPGGSILVARQFISTAYLWEKVRVQGGAYGAGVGFDRHSGMLSFTSYRDPNLLKTLDVFDNTADFLRTAAISETELVRAIIGVIGNLDTYMLPDAKGLTALQWHLQGTSVDNRQHIRDQILGTNLADIRGLADAFAAVAKNGRVAVLGAEDAITAANAERGGSWLTISKVL
jgi:presequence protease